MDEKMKANALAIGKQAEKDIAAAVEVANEKGFDAGVAFLMEQGISALSAPQMLGLALGTWEPVEYDENGKVKKIRN